MYTSSMVVDYSRGKVGHDSSHKDGTLRYAWSLDTTGDIYASNKSLSMSSNIHVGRVNEHIDKTRDEALETTRVLFVGPTTDDVFSRNVDDVPNHVAPFYRVEVWLGWVGSQESCFLRSSRPVHSQH